MNDGEYKQRLEEDGYVVLKNALNIEEVRLLRNIVLDFFHDGNFYYLSGGKARPDALCEPGLKAARDLLKHKSISKVLKEITDGDVMYCHHSDAHSNLVSGWHKDSHSRAYHNMDVWSETNGQTYGVYRVGIYLQDHEKGGSNGYAIKVKKGSHLSAASEGEVVEIFTEQGDAIIFDCRISHVGETDLLLKTWLGRFLKYSILQLLRNTKSAYRVRDWYHRRKGIEDRLSLFLTYGKRNSFTEEHMKSNMDRQVKQTGIGHHALPGDIVQNLKSVGIHY